MRAGLGITAIVTSVFAQAQVNYPFPDSAAMWVQSWSFMVTPPPMPQFETMGISNICITGADTLIDGVSFSKVEQCNGDYVGALRQDAGKVYFQPADSLEAFLLYDFTLAVGDTAHDVYVDGGLAFSGWSDYPDVVDYVVTEVGAVEDRIFVRLEQPLGGPDQQWIEGFGSPWGLFSQQDPINISGSSAGIGCMSHLDTVWSFNEWEITPILDRGCTPQYLGINAPQGPSLNVWPDPTTGPVTIGPDLDPHAVVLLRDAIGRAINVSVQRQGGYATVDLSNTPNGTYLLCVLSKGNRWMHRIIKSDL